MTAVYIETSALLRWVFGEHGAGRVASLMESAPDPVSSVLTLLEAQRAIVRARSQDSAAATSTLRLVELLVRLSRRWTLAEVSADVRARAARSFPVEPVRTVDAIHLSTALEFAKVFPGLSVLTFDRRILANLEPLGLTPATVDG